MIVLAIDTETTGLVEAPLMPLDRQPHVIQLTMILADLETGEEQDCWTVNVRPPRQDLVSDKITQITGITWDALKDCHPFKYHYDSISSKIASVSAVAAHNLMYDKQILDYEAARLGKVIDWPERQICTVEATCHLRGYRLDLSTLHELLLKEKFRDAHQSEPDTRALVRCLTEMYKRGMV